MLQSDVNINKRNFSFLSGRQASSSKALAQAPKCIGLLQPYQLVSTVRQAHFGITASIRTTFQLPPSLKLQSESTINIPSIVMRWYDLAGDLLPVQEPAVSTLPQHTHSPVNKNGQLVVQSTFCSIVVCRVARLPQPVPHNRFIYIVKSMPHEA